MLFEQRGRQIDAAARRQHDVDQCEIDLGRIRSSDVQGVLQVCREQHAIAGACQRARGEFLHAHIIVDNQDRWCRRHGLRVHPCCHNPPYRLLGATPLADIV